MTLAIPLFIVFGVLAWVLRPGKRPAKPRKLTILVTVIPPFVVAIAALIFQLLHNATGNVGVADISNTLFIVGLSLIGIAILALVGFAVKRKGEIVKGTGFSICIAVIVYIIVFGLLEWLGGV